MDTLEITIVTGASSGIGRSLARRIAARGSAVALLARREDELDSLANEIVEAGGQALALRCDVTDRGAVHEAIARVEAKLGPPTRLVANVGGGQPTDALHFDAQHIAQMIDLNLLSAANCIEAVLPGMLERKRGHLVAMSSLAGELGLPGAAGYSSSKAALTTMMESLRIDLRGTGVDVTVLVPGFVRTRPVKAGARTKRRPFRLELEVATARMVHAIESRKPRDAFPRSLAALVWLLAELPPALGDPLLARIGTRAKAEPGGSG